jgi:4'-phosphopantetheinyl transferase EntD
MSTSQPPDRALLRSIVTAPVAVRERCSDVDESMLFGEERAAIARAIVPRRREFATTRLCAREALAELGQRPVALLPDEAGAPVWPSGFVGSLTHCDGYRAAAVARSAELHSIGIDAEVDRELPDGVLELIALAAERAELATLPSDPAVNWPRLLFSCKESIYKAWYPLMHSWLDFDDAHVSIDPAGAFQARLLVPGPVLDGHPRQRVTGRWVAGHGLLVAVAVFERRTRALTRQPTPMPEPVATKPTAPGRRDG